MRGGEDQKTEEKKIYRYKVCEKCGVKLHIYTYSCWKCGERPLRNEHHLSTDPKDAKYSRYLCSVEKCTNECYAVNNLNKEPCKPIICFGTGRGKCDLCNRTEFTRYNCCQNVQKEFEKIDTGKMNHAIGKLTSKHSVSAEQFEDDIPF